MGRWAVRGTGFTVGVIVIVTLAWALMRASNVIVLVVISVLLASGLEPAIGWLRSRTGLPRAPTILVVYVAFFVLVAALILLVVPSAVDQFGALGDRLPALLDKVDSWAKTQQPPLSDIVERGVTTIRGAVTSTPKVPPSDQLHLGRRGRRGRDHLGDQRPDAHLLLAHRPSAAPALLPWRSSRPALATGCGTRGTRSRRGWASGCAAS